MLCEKGYGWIVYIELLVGHSWICGKTGTADVSQSLVDFDFIITDVNNPNNPSYQGSGREYARRFHPELVYSDHEFVLCKNFNSETRSIRI